MRPVYVKIVDNKLLFGTTNKSLDSTFLQSAMKVSVPLLASSTSSSSHSSVNSLTDSNDDNINSDEKDKFEGSSEEEDLKNPINGFIEYIINYTPEIIPCLIKIANKHPKLLKILSLR